MNKNYQKELTNWLKQQSIISSWSLNISRILGFISSFLIIAQAWLLASILNSIIIEHIQRKSLFLPFILLFIVFILRALVFLMRELVGFKAGQYIRYKIRRKLLNILQEIGPVWINTKQTGNWATIIIEQIDNMQDYYSRYLPQMTLAIYLPLMIFITILPINLAAAIILICTAPLVALFMSIVGIGAAEANRRNFLALSRLSGNLLDKVRGIETIRIFGRGDAETENIKQASQYFRKRTMDVLRLAFLSSGVLEFFTSLSIALVAIYFGFSYLGQLNFGNYGTAITLSAGFFVLILAPEFFQPLRDLGMFYHSKAQAVAAADCLKLLLEKHFSKTTTIKNIGKIILNPKKEITILAENLCILSPEGKQLVGPINFYLPAGKRVGLVGLSGSGKSLLLHTLAGFFPYIGSLKINNYELYSLDMCNWRKLLSWVGQYPKMLPVTIRDNIMLSATDINPKQLKFILDRTLVSEFIRMLPKGLDTKINDEVNCLSVGQTQRLAVARALVNSCKLMLLDEPTASLDEHSEKLVMKVLNDASFRQTTLMVTHKLSNIAQWDEIWVMENGSIIEKGNYVTLCANRSSFFFKLLTSGSILH